MFFGYADRNSGRTLRIYNFDTRHVVITRDMKLLELIYYQWKNKKLEEKLQDHTIHIEEIPWTITNQNNQNQHPIEVDYIKLKVYWS